MLCEHLYRPIKIKYLNEQIGPPPLKNCDANFFESTFLGKNGKKIGLKFF